MAETNWLSLNGRVGIVTGGGKGIGRAIAQRLSRAGAKIVVADIDLQAAQKVVAEIKSAGGQADCVQSDVASAKSVEGMVDFTLKTFGKIDILINNAGIACKAAPLHELTEKEWDCVMDVNLKSMFHCCRAVIPDMMSRKAGRIVNVASISGKEGNPNMIPYSVSKAGVICFTKALAKELIPYNIFVNCVSPAVTKTTILEQLNEQAVEYMKSKVPLGRLGEPEEIAAVVHFLASDDASFVTGQCYDVSGGRATY
jgi:3-oxoacyl-[acyl-carrier protein] reductase